MGQVSKIESLNIESPIVKSLVMIIFHSPFYYAILKLLILTLYFFISHDIFFQANLKTHFHVKWQN